MVYIVSITSQGQITIPAAIRRKLGLNTLTKAIVDVEKEKVTIKPTADLLSLAGSLAHKAIKGKSIDEIIKIEEDAVGEAVADRYRKKE